MQYTITINQKAFFEHFPELDLIDAAIYDYISDYFYYQDPDFIDGNHEGLSFYGFFYDNFIEALPIIKIKSKRGLYKRIRRLEDYDIIRIHEDNQINGELYLARGMNFYEPSIIYEVTK